MFPKIDPTTTPSWQALLLHYEEMKSTHMEDLFATDADRFTKFSIGLPDILFDYSKNIITEKTMQQLIQLALDCELPAAIKAMFGGEKINETEDRSVLHTALRNFSGEPVMSDGKDVMPDVKAVLDQMKS
ncbi:MAG TPA: hypothetical protein VKH37_05075, partial [Ferruginibacter sp.]|nr:hypothetical protein [Ferruginibacter sp.]